MTKVEYSVYLLSSTWASVRARKLKEAGRCADCHLKNELIVHHLTYERVGGREEMEDLEVLCRRCHNERHIDELLAGVVRLEPGHKERIRARQQQLKNECFEEDQLRKRREEADSYYM